MKIFVEGGTLKSFLQELAVCGMLLRGMKKIWPMFEAGYCVDTYNLRCLCVCVGGGGGGRWSYYMEWPIKSNLAQLSV